MSSYFDNDYSALFGCLSFMYNPKVIVECGVLDGYSLLGFASMAPENCKIYGIDLFEDYPYKNSSYKNVLETIEKELGPGKNVKLIKKDAIKAANDFENNQIDILHIDISNDGGKLWDMFDAWEDKLKETGIVLFEGGSKERDEIDWMKKYNKKKINFFKRELKTRGSWETFTFTPFPSLTICRKIK